MAKNKCDPEKELVRRRGIELILQVVGVSTFFTVALLFLFKIIEMAHIVITNLNHPQIQYALGVLGLGLMAVFAFGMLSYAAWNNERIEELSKIVESVESVESEENTDVLPE